MNTVLKDALTEALTENYIWKGKKIKEGKTFVQEEEKIKEMSPFRLKECWDHCKIMLQNDDPKNLGRFNVLKDVYEQIKKCNVELLLRYYENAYLPNENRKPEARFNLMMILNNLISSHPEVTDWDSKLISDVASADLPAEFNRIKIFDVLESFKEGLGAFDKQHLTMTFITKMGIWLTKAENIEFGVNTSRRDKLQTIKQKLKLPADLKLRFKEKGLSYHEMKCMLALPSKQRYSDMSTEQLVTLRNKVLMRFIGTVETHIRNWKILKRQIEEVATSKGINLNEL